MTSPSLLASIASASDDLPWYGIHTKSNQEKLVSVALKHKGYEQYLPVYRQRRRWSDRIVETERALFPGYLFCRFDSQRRLPIITTPGVVDVIGFGSEPAAIPENEIEAIRSIVRSGANVAPCPFLREGQRVRVNRGSLEGLEGILVKNKTDWRVVVSVQMLQRSVSVDVDWDWVTAL